MFFLNLLIKLLLIKLSLNNFSQQRRLNKMLLKPISLTSQMHVIFPGGVRKYRAPGINRTPWEGHPRCQGKPWSWRSLCFLALTGFLLKGDVGLPGPPGPMGEPGIGLMGPKVMSVQVYRNSSQSNQIKGSPFVVGRATEGSQGLWGVLDWKVKASPVLQWVQRNTEASFIPA